MSEPNVYPVVSLELSSMRQCIRTLLTQRQTELDKDIEAALDEICSQENVTKTVREAVQRDLNQMVQDEVRRQRIKGWYAAAVTEAVNRVVQELNSENVPNEAWNSTGAQLEYLAVQPLFRRFMEDLVAKGHVFERATLIVEDEGNTYQIDLDLLSSTLELQPREEKYDNFPTK